MSTPFNNLLGKLKFSGSIVIIGLGNPDRADDGIGIALASRLKAISPERVHSEEERSVEGIVLNLLDHEEVGAILFIDAADFGGKPGEFKLFSSEEIDKFVPAITTHKVPISLLMGLIQQKNIEPYLLGVQPESLEFLGEMSKSVRKTVSILEKALTQLLERRSGNNLVGS